VPIANIIQNKGEHSGDGVDAIAALEYNGCYYEACDIDWVLEKFGLPAEITADMAGKHLSYLESDGGAGYKGTAGQTDIELYQYVPSPCRAVCVLRDGKDYMAALFCNFKQFDSNTNTELRELYQIYGIDSSEDIASISHTDWNKRKIIGNKVTDIDAIAEFYTITTSLASYGNDDFQAEVFDEIPEEEQAAANTAFADDNTTICIETTSGLRFFIQVYPSYHWIYGHGTMSYYKMDSAMQAWFNSNIK
ncbi:MAG: hypothetical protein RSG53_01110, partial [Oscillospiraceae bacterium]